MPHVADASLEVIYRVMYAMVPDPEDARDLAHDCYVKYQERLNTGWHPQSEEAFLKVMARRVAIDYFRRKSPQIVAMEGLNVTEAEASIAQWMTKIIESLPDGYREAVRWADLELMPQREVAQRLGLSLSGAKSKVQRGRAMLLEKMKQACDFEQDRYGRITQCHPKKPCPC
ncbi:MAG: sigma-70 family RNA polymerase sigma factor [Acidobacteria bacterium]|nr:sigma-70 family RNA polymerase sigma factor [Acidobacteriota bacterium]